MQATVRSYDPQTRSGTVLTDDGIELAYTAAALAGSGLRRLRIGQRVHVDVEKVGTTLQVRALTIHTLRD
ncbi:MAG TPA: hypothetical protein VIL34_15705 [Actinopolymorphaceae bacterium]